MIGATRTMVFESARLKSSDPFGTVVGTARLVPAAKAGTPVWSFSSNPGGLFAIDSSSGLVTVAADLDFAGGGRSLGIRVTGIQPPVADTIFVVSVDAPEKPLIEVASPSEDVRPDFNVMLPVAFGDYRDAQIGGTLTLEHSTNPPAVWSAYQSRVLTADDINGVPFTMTGTSAVPVGRRMFRGKLSSVAGALSEYDRVEHDIVASFDPASLFRLTLGDRGMIHDFTNASNTIFRDIAGTIPVTANGNPIGRSVDLSPCGNDLVSLSDIANQPIFRIASGINCAESAANSPLVHPTLDLNFSKYLTVVGGWRNRRNGTTGHYWNISEVQTAEALYGGARMIKVFATPPGLRFDTFPGHADQYTFVEIDSGDSVTYLPHVMSSEHIFGGFSDRHVFRLNGVEKAMTIVGIANSFYYNFKDSRFFHLLTGANSAQGTSAHRLCWFFMINRKVTASEMASLEALAASKCGATLP